MTAGLTVEPVPIDGKPVFERLFQFYLHEHAAFTGRRPDDGLFAYPWMGAYWREPDARWPFQGRLGDEIAALALVRLDDDGVREMAEFFVLNRFRGRGVGTAFARDLFARFPGPWKLNQVAANAGATRFWRRVLADLGDYTEAPLTRDDGLARIEQRFVSP